ncbi:MAG TPA: hypothetical protein VF597_01690 [Candidatus Saccharimonadales bacterium]|jgi:hypothetical protein
MGLFRSILPLLTGTPTAPKLPNLSKLTDRQLIELEAEIGGRLFGPVAEGHKREFFCLDQNTWIWHEEWTDENNQRLVSSTRYEVHENGVLKAQDGKVYKFIEGEELRNLMVAVRLYYEAVARDIYRIDPQTGRPLTQMEPATATL